MRANLALTRQMLDRYFEDHGKYPDGLDTLVSNRYLRSLPQDPITGSNASWVIVPPAVAENGGVADVRSGAPGNGLDGSAYGEW